MDTALHTTQWGDAGPLVVMVHGSAQGSEVGGDRHFSRQAALVGGWRVVVPDRPGHGRSPSPGRPDDAEADGKLVAELPAFAAVAGRVAELGGGRHVTIASPHHFPQLVSDEFNQLLAQFMTDAEKAGAPA